MTNHYFNNVIGNPLESTVAVCHLIFDGVLQRYPKLKLSWHTVAASSRTTGRAWTTPGGPGLTAVPLSKTLLRRTWKSFTSTPSRSTQNCCKRLIDKFGADHVVLGTDYPYDMGEEDPLGLIKQVKRLPKAARDLIQGGNAARLLDIKF